VHVCVCVGVYVCMSMFAALHKPMLFGIKMLSPKWCVNVRVHMYEHACACTCAYISMHVCVYSPAQFNAVCVCVKPYRGEA
jgi:hypothetical protein